MGILSTIDVPTLSLDGTIFDETCFSFVYSIQSSSISPSLFSFADAKLLESIIFSLNHFISTKKSFSVDTDESVVQFKDNTNNDGGLTSFSLPVISLVRQLILGDRCLKNVHTFELIGLNELRELRVGEYSCTQSTGFKGISIWNDSVCRIVDCPNLISIHFGDYSFSGYKQLSLERLPALRSIFMGLCFCYAEEFSLKSMLRWNG